MSKRGNGKYCVRTNPSIATPYRLARIEGGKYQRCGVAAAESARFCSVIGVDLTVRHTNRTQQDTLRLRSLKVSESRFQDGANP